MHFNLYITFNKNKYLHSNFKDLGSQSYIEPGNASVPSGTAVAKHHLSVGTRLPTYVVTQKMSGYIM